MRWADGSRSRLLASFLLAIGSAHMTRLYMDWSDRTGVMLGISIFLILLALFRVSGRDQSMPTGFVWSVPAIVALGFWLHFEARYGWFDWEKILFHASAGLDRSPAVWIEVVSARTVLLGVVSLVAGLLIAMRLRPALRRADILIASGLVLLNPAVTKAFVLFWPQGEAHRSALVEVYREPTFSVPENPPSFVHVFLESAEQTFSDQTHFAGTMAPLQPLAARGLSATGMLQVANTEWSVAGMAASNCGVPLFPLGLFDRDRFLLKRFMPNAVCIGDVLKRAGYDLTYMVGSDAEFGGINKLYLQHGFNRVMDNPELPAATEQRTPWGIHDDALFARALDVLRAKAAAGAPFGLVIETIGGHAPYGEIAPSCMGRDTVSGLPHPMLGALRCTNELLGEFLSQAEQSGLLDDVIVIVQSDHLAMKSSLDDILDDLPRRNLFFLYGPGIGARVHSGSSSQLDIYPTIMQALGFHPEGGRAAFGTSLWTHAPTLVEKVGAENLNDLIRSDRAVSRRIWQH